MPETAEQPRTKRRRSSARILAGLHVHEHVRTVAPRELGPGPDVEQHRPEEPMRGAERIA